MKRLSFVLCLLSFTAFATAEWRHGERMDVWPSLEKMPDFQPHQMGAMSDEVRTPGFKKEEHRMPYLEWFEAPAQKPLGCMILISGGSYQCCCDVALIKTFRDRFTALGFQCVNFCYRTPWPKGGLKIHQTAWEDGQRAVRLVRSEAAKRGFDPERIGVVSMSAGSHLAVLLATSSQTPAYAPVDDVDKLPCHVNWAIPGAPAFTLSDGYGCPNGLDGDRENVTLDPAIKFDAKTCPICILHGADDPYSPNGSTQIYRRLRQLGVPAELHLAADRKHGFHGLERGVEFMRQMGYLGPLAPEEERRVYTGDYTRETIREEIWPAGRMPGREHAFEYVPYVTWYLPKELKTKAIQLVTPGGAYMHCNDSGEGKPIAEYFNAKGMAVVVLNYRVPRVKDQPKYLSAWQDAQRAIRHVRHMAASRGLDGARIGIMGFSAGGHLTLMCATSARRHAYWPDANDPTEKETCNVQWAVPVYPAYTLTDMGKDETNLTGGNDDSAVIVPEFSFDLDTPPMCFLHGDADCYAAMGSVKIWEKLRRMGIQCDLHTFATRGHCFQFKAAPGTGSYGWLDRVWEFLTNKGLNK